MGHHGGEAIFGVALSPLPLGAQGFWGCPFQSSELHPPERRALWFLCEEPGHQEPPWRPVARRAALNELGEGPPVPLHSSKNLTQGVGLSLVLGLWDLPGLCLFIPVRGEAPVKMAQSGV